MTREMMKSVGMASGMFGPKQARMMQRKLEQMAKGLNPNQMPDPEEQLALPLPAMSAEEKEARRKKTRMARKARKSQRR
jgi:hypothetical protein